MNLFCFGFGQVARNFVKKLISENIELKLSFTSRKSKNEIDKSFKGNFFKFDSEFFEKDLIKNLKSADHILISIPVLLVLVLDVIHQKMHQLLLY